MVQGLIQDHRYALRMLRRSPGFTLTAVVTLALGIGATTLVFSVTDALVFHPFPYRNAERLVVFRVHELKQAGYDGAAESSIPEFVAFRHSNRSFEDLIGFRNTAVLYRNGEGTQRVEGAWVTTNAFAVLGVPPRLGRTLLAEDERAAAPPVCVISDRFWREQFSGDVKALGAVLDFNGQQRTVVGIMPPRFEFLDVEFWIPYRLTSTEAGQPQYLEAIGMLNPGVRLDEANAEYDRMKHRFAEAFPNDYPDRRFTASVRSLVDNAVGNFKRLLFALFAAVAMLLLIACSNVANLLLARATVREREISIRLCLGASRGRVMRQLLVESWLLAVPSGVAACVLAYFAVRTYAELVPRDRIPHEALVQMNWLALWFTLGVTLLTAVLCGLAPAMGAARKLSSVARRGSQTPGHSKLRAALIVAEVSLSMVLLVGGGLMARTFFAITHVEPGFDSSNLATVDVSFRGVRRASGDEQRRIFGAVLEAVGRVPGVIAAALTMETPGLNGGPEVELDVVGEAHAGHWNSLLQASSENYFRTVGRSLKRGREFATADMLSAKHAAIVNETFVRAFFGTRDPVGQRVRFHFDRWIAPPSDPEFEVIGVVSDAKNHGLREPVAPQAYIPWTAIPQGAIGVIAKTSIPPLLVADSIRKQIRAVDRDVVIGKVGTVQKSIEERVYTEPRFGLVSIGGFAAVGLMLAMVGVFSLMAYSVATRTHEIGIRVALGARRGEILLMVLQSGLELVVAGVVIGLGTSLALGRFLASEVWGISTADPWTLAAVAATLFITGMIACLAPALRAAGVDPVVALREE